MLPHLIIRTYCPQSINDVLKRHHIGALILASAGCILGRPADAQQIKVNGTSFDIPSGTVINTGVLAGASGGYGILGTNNGSLTNGGPFSLITGGASAHAVFMETGSTAVLQDAAIHTLGGGSHALDAFNPGSAITLRSSTVFTEGNSAFGARAVGGGVINLADSSITTTGNGSYGLNASGAGSALHAAGVSVLTTGAPQSTTKAVGGVVEAGGLLSIANNAARQTSVSTTGFNAFGLLAQSAGTLIATGDSLPVVVRTSGSYAPGAWVQNAGSLMNLTNVDVETAGPNASGAVGVDAGARLVIQGGRIATKGDASSGVVSNGSVVAIRPNSGGEGTTILTAGSFSHGLEAYGGGTIDADSVNVLTEGESSRAARAAFGGTLTLTDSSFVTQGAYAYGLAAIDQNSFIKATNVNVETMGPPAGVQSANGIVAEFGGAVSINGVSKVRTTGLNGIGLLAQAGEDTTLNATVLTFDGEGGASIETLGGFAPAVEACSRAPGSRDCTDPFGNDVAGVGALTAINVNNARLATKGEGSFGLYAFGQNASVDGRNLDISTVGVDAHAVVTRNGGAVTVSDSTMSTTGTGAAGLFMTGPAGIVGTATLTNVIVSAARSASVIVDGGIADIRMQGSKAETNSGSWLIVGATDAANPAVADVRLDSFQVKGAVATASGATSNVTLTNATVWQMTGNSNLTKLSNDASSIVFSAPGGPIADASSYKQLTVRQYSGNRGVIGLNTFLGGDESPTDRLVLDSGGASGNTSLLISNAGGGGELTTGDGILIVDAQNGATTTTGSFYLGNRVAAGAYEYSLHRSDSSNADKFYLRSTIIDPEEPSRPITPEWPDTGVPASEIPNYREEVPLNMAIPTLSGRYGLIMLGTYHDRNGEDYANAGAVGSGRSSSWGRVLGETGSVGKTGFKEFKKQGASYNYDIAGFQIGHDLYRAQDKLGKRDIAGVYLGVGAVSSQVDAVLGGRAGKATLNGTTLGGYWTRKGPSGGYLDGVVQGTLYQDVKTRSVMGQRLSTDGFGIAASIEGGYPLALGNDWAIEPQAQLIYQHISISKAKDDYASIKFKDMNAGIGRVGARVTKQFSTTSGEEATGWIRANIWQHMGADARTSFAGSEDGSPVTLGTSLGGTWAQIGLGVSGQLSKRVSVYAGADYNQSLGASDGNSVSGRAGMRVRW